MALCEREPERTREVNVDHTVTLAQRLVDAGVFVVFLSSNTVFDGSTPFANSSQLPNPQCEYGRQKAAAEAEILNFGDKAAVIRFTKIFDPNTRLMRGWVSSLRYDAPIQPFSDAMIAPVSIAFAATVISAVVEHQSGGIHQVSASHDISYVHAATYLATQLGANPKLIRAVSSKDTGGPIFPKHTTLDTITLSQLGFDAPPPTWALDQFL